VSLLSGIESDEERRQWNGRREIFCIIYGTGRVIVERRRRMFIN
jgi:hypothetical protein